MPLSWHPRCIYQEYPKEIPMFVASLAHKILVMSPANAQELATVSEALSQHRTERTRFVIIDIKNIADNWRFHRPALKKRSLPFSITIWKRRSLPSGQKTSISSMGIYPAQFLKHGMMHKSPAYVHAMLLRKRCVAQLSDLKSV